MALANMTQKETDRENFEHCKRIAETLEKYANGEIFKCPVCGEECECTEEENENGDTVYIMECGCTTEEEPEQMSLYDYFSDCLDIEFRCDSGKEYRSVCVMVTCGGPNIYIDTASKAVELYWCGDRAKYSLLSDTVNAIDYWAEEYWNCL